MNDRSHSQIPSRLETLLLRAALLDGEAARSAYREWKAEVDIDALDHGSQRMLPLLASNLVRVGMDDDLVPFFQGHRRQALAANAHRIAGNRRALAALDEAGIETMVLKGTALVASGLCELGLRPIGDVDVLIRPEDRSRTIDLLVNEGWETDTFPDWYVKRTFYREAPAWVWRKDGVQLDLHWGALHLVRDPVAERQLWGRAEEADIGGVPVLVPSPEDQAMQAWLHAAEHNPVPPLRWAADAVTAIGARSESFDWDYCVETAVTQRTVIQTLAALEYLAGPLDQPVPQPVIDRLRRERVTRLECREHAARNRPPAERNRLEDAIVALQDHRRQSLDLLGRSPLAGLRDLRRQRRRLPDTSEVHDLRDGPLVLDRERDPLDTLLYGWSFPETDGRWTDGPEASLNVRVEPRTESLLVAELAGFVGRAGRSQRVTVHVNGRRYARLRFNDDDLDLKARQVRIPVPATPDGTAQITFRIASPSSPTSLGLPADDRRLGLQLRSLRLDD